MLFLELLLLVVGFFLYRYLINRYNKKKRPYMIDSYAVDLINDSNPEDIAAALRVVYKKKCNYKIISKFNRALAKEIYFINAKKKIMKMR